MLLGNKVPSKWCQGAMSRASKLQRQLCSKRNRRTFMSSTLTDNSSGSAPAAPESPPKPKDEPALSQPAPGPESERAASRANEPRANWSVEEEKRMADTHVVMEKRQGASGILRGYLLFQFRDYIPKQALCPS